jgi:Tol biopolymer transport system component
MSLIDSPGFIRSLSLALFTSLSFHSLSLATPKLSQPRTLVFNSISQQAKTTGLFTISTHGTNRRKLTPSLKNGINSPVWSPNGQKLAFTANGDQDIYVVNSDGSKLTKVLAEEFCKGISWFLNWSANSQKLVMTRSCDGSTSDAPGSVAL